MSNSDFTGCLYCDHGDIELMRKNGYDNDKYIYCELKGSVIEVIEGCPSFFATNIEEKKRANKEYRMSRLISEMAQSFK